jgi:hypothetical protein
MLVLQMNVEGVPEKEAVLLIRKKLPGNPLGRRSPLDPGVVEDAALFEAEIVGNILLWVWDAVLPELTDPENAKAPLDVELRDPDLEAVAFGVAVSTSRRLLSTEGKNDGNTMTTLEEVAEDVDVGSPIASELLLLGRIRVAVDKTEPSPSTNALEDSAIDTILGAELGSGRSNVLAETLDCVDCSARLVWLIELSITAETVETDMLILLLLPTIVEEIVGVAMLANEELRDSGRPETPVKARDASTKVVIEMVTFAVTAGAAMLDVMLPSTTSAVEKDWVKLPATLETKYDENSASPVEILECVGCGILLLGTTLFSLFIDVKATARLAVLLPSAVEEAGDA